MNLGMKDGSSRAPWRSSWQIATRCSFSSGSEAWAWTLQQHCACSNHTWELSALFRMTHYDCSNVLNGSPTILMHKPPNCFHIFRCWAHGRSPWPLVVFKWCSASLEVRMPLETPCTTHDLISIRMSYQFSSLRSRFAEFQRRIWCLLSAPVSHPCWNCKCEGTRGDKHSCCATPNVHTATPLGILNGDVPCSQAQRAHSRTAIGWRSVELVSKLFDTPMYAQNL